MTRRLILMLALNVALLLVLSGAWLVDKRIGWLNLAVFPLYLYVWWRWHKEMGRRAS